MITVAGGDSFVFGSELHDCGPHWSSSTFPALLANDGYLCVAWPGYGNDSIARSIIHTCERLRNEEKMVIVSWTFPGRYEFRFAYDTGQKTSPWYTINSWTIEEDSSVIEKEFITKNDSILKHQLDTIEKAKSTGVQDFAKTFYRHVGSTEYWEIYSSLKEIVYLQNYLKVNNIPYMFTCADNILFENHTVRKADGTISSLVNQIDQDNWFWFPAGTSKFDTRKPRGFYQWAVENKYPIGTTHPLEQAHADAAQLMKDKFNELVKKSV
jgi:hypothetical protein